MIAIAGGPDRLRPHIKTHKLAEIVRMQMDAGIRKVKCATIAEAEMAASCGVPDILLAYQCVGPKAERFLALVRKFPEIHFSTIVDSRDAIEQMGTQAKACGYFQKLPAQAEFQLELLLDIDCGQHRCGIEPGPEAAKLYGLIATSPGLKAGGLHVYDGHIHDSDPAIRIERCQSAFAPVEAFVKELKSRNLPLPRIVAGGSPTFPILARHPHIGAWERGSETNRLLTPPLSSFEEEREKTGGMVGCPFLELSPGTTVLWDYGYATKLADIDFLNAAMVLTRIISKPTSVGANGNRLCLDLGHKALASENPHPRVFFPQLPEANAVGHSEEHLVVETPRARDFALGTPIYGVPWHICPTVALHSHAVPVKNGRAVGHWRVTARDRILSV
jgi:D-serine deaminase-like pyridoxal phosphate-dependent protein